MRYFGYSLHDAECMTLREYSYEIFAWQLKELDKQKDMHMQAYLNHVVTGTKERGKKRVPLYPKFKDFFDYEKEEQKITQPQRVESTSRRKLMQQIAAYNS